MEWAEARRLLETAIVRGKPAKLVVDEEVMVAARRQMQERYTSFNDLAPPLDTLFYRGVPLEFSPAVQGVVPVWKEEVVKVGDLVNVVDGSCSMGLVGGVWRPTFPAFGRKRAFVWRVMAMNGRFPAYMESFSAAVQDNDVLLVDPEDNTRLLATREKFLKVVPEETAPGDESECRLAKCEMDIKGLGSHLENKLESFTLDLDDTNNDVEALQRKVRELEQQVNALTARPLPCCAKRVGELERRMKSMEDRHVWTPFA